MICPKCGKETDAGRTFCVWCGATYGVAPVGTVEEQPTAVPPQQIGGMPRKFFIGGVFVTLILPALGAVTTSFLSGSVDLGVKCGVASFITVVITMRVVSYMLRP